MRENLAYNDDEFTSENEGAFDIPERAPEISVSTDGVRDYLRGLGRASLLRAEEEVVLSRQIEAGVVAQGVLDEYADGDEEIFDRLSKRHGLTDAEMKIDLRTLAAEGERARQQMIQANLRLVVSIAKRYRFSDLEFLDLVSEGNVGLVHAVEKFDYTKGFKFSTYATWWIRQAITRAIADKGRAVRIPVHMHEKMNKLLRKRSEMQVNLGRVPTDEELAIELSLTPKLIRTLLGYGRSTVSLDTPLTEEGDTLLGDVLPATDTVSPTEGVFDAQLAQAVGQVLKQLPEREAEVVKLRFGIGGDKPMTLDEIGACFGLTRERIRQIEKKAMDKLRKNSGQLKAFREELE